MSTVALVVGGLFALLGATMLTRGWIYTLRPDGALAQKRKKVNLQRGFTTDMKVFGRKVRRLGLMILLVGGVLLGFQVTHLAEAQNATSPPSTPDALPDASSTPPPVG